MISGKLIACAAGAALVACLGTAGVAGASGVQGQGTGWCVGGCAETTCAYVDENADGVCDNCGAVNGACGARAQSADAGRGGSAVCSRCGRADCDGTCADGEGGACGICGRTDCDGTCADGDEVCGYCGNATCDGTHDHARLRAHDGTCVGGQAHAHGHHHSGR
ncbi:hypothetical protein [Olsenella profusa]|uniref:Tryptophan synthase alpha chain n=1 Tax=Olsenella profusa TaxID=138595 RepID=A0ABS2F1C8_9ACTN|nr:hypothetical protein [Olsenella profusa]MBM6774372.1 hypothetical protein [Olsenella profusa]